jgi:hypothetical protein
VQKAIGQLAVEDVETTAGKALERVKIMRVFDFVGVSEAVNELRAGLESPLSQQGSLVETPRARPARHEIPDSEDEDDDDDDDMLLDWELTQHDQETEKNSRASPDNIDEKLGLLFIDNIAHAVNPLLKSNYVQGTQHFTPDLAHYSPPAGQSLFVTFMRSLSHFTATHNISTILINTAVTPRPNYVTDTSLTGPPGTWVEDPTARQPSFLDQPSIFAASTARPALGKPLTYCVDLHLFLSELPKRRRDSEIVYGGKMGRAELVAIMEVLGDRWEGRLGRWAAFVMENGVELKAAF